MRVDLFDFDLPPERIALRPATPRDAARMLCVAGDGRLSDAHVRDLPSLLRKGDCLIFNDTRVIPAQLEGKRGGGEARPTPFDPGPVRPGVELPQFVLELPALVRPQLGVLGDALEHGRHAAK